MEADLQRRVQRYGWDRAAAYYEESWKQQLKPAQDCLMEMAALLPGEKVLETACGTGLVTFRIASAIQPGGEVLATDLSDGMIELATQRARDLNIGNVNFRQMDAEKLSLQEAGFDAVLCALGLMYVPDPIQSLKEAHRILKPGGRAVMSVWGARKNCGWADIFPIVDKRVASDVCPMFFMQGTGNTLEHSLREAGFGDIEVQRLSVTLQYDSPGQAVMAAFAGGPVALAYRKFDHTTRQEAHAEYLESIAPFRQGDGYNIPGEFVTARGTKLS